MLTSMIDAMDMMYEARTEMKGLSKSEALRFNDAMRITSKVISM